MELILITLLILPFIIIFYKRNRFFPWSTRLNLYRMRDMLEVLIMPENSIKFILISLKLAKRLILLSIQIIMLFRYLNRK